MSGREASQQPKRGLGGQPIHCGWNQCPLILTCPAACRTSLAQVTLEVTGSSWVLSSRGPNGVQPRLMQWVVEHHVGKDGDFQLLFRPAVLFRQFEFFWRSQIFQVLQHFLYKLFCQQNL